MSLNVQEIKGFRAADKSYKKYDSRGLLLLVKPNGSKLWYFKYRFGGKEKKLPIGAFPEISLSQARQLRDRARLKVSDGIDPMLERKRKKARIKLGAENTFEVIANKYIDEKMVPEGRAEATLRKARWFLDLLKPEALAHAMMARRQDGIFRMQKGYDHSYFFISTFMEDHVVFAAEALYA